MIQAAIAVFARVEEFARIVRQASRSELVMPRKLENNEFVA
jgi:hypothetical protein